MAGVGVPETSNRLCVIDLDTRERFLVDTGAEISVLAVKNKFRVQATNAYSLFAANNTPIKTYGEKIMKLNFGLRRSFKWTFIIADVKTSILGADFLREHKLSVDLHRRKLIDTVTELSVNTIKITTPGEKIYLVSQNNVYQDILRQFPDVLRPMTLKTPPKHDVIHYIETNGPPLSARVRPLPPDKYKAAKDEFTRMIEMGICKPSKSPWASPLHIVKKKDGSLRICGDYRRLNSVTIPDKYPIPRIQDFTYQLYGKEFFSKLDIKKAYYWIPMAEEDAKKTAIITPFGLFEFNCMTFGLRNAAQTFQRFIHEVLRGLDFCFPYIDDVLIFSKCEKEHKEHVKQVLTRFNKYGVTLNVDKCEFGKTEISFLGYEVSNDGIKPNKERVEAIASYPKPKNVQELRRFLGMLNFYRDCLPRQAELQSELNKYLHNRKKNDKTPIDWSAAADQAFKKCRESITKATTLSHPAAGAKLYLMTDASDHSIGAVLHQRVDKVTRPLAFFSKAMSETQRRYSVYDRELLAMYIAVKHFRRLIEGNEVTIITDHKPLSYALTRNPSNADTPRRERHLNYISQFISNIQYIEGDENKVADALSRIEEISLPSTIDYAQLSIDQKRDEELKELRLQPNLKFEEIILPGTSHNITCEMSVSTPRPYLPPTYRQIAFTALHDLCHPGTRTTRKMVTSKYFWPSMQKDVGKWAKSCIGCQRAKVTRHVVTPIGEFPESQRFEHVHLDIVGPLCISNDYRYCITMIDRCTKWPEAVPVRDISAETVAKAFYESWIARFGCPLRLTTDQGRQFESALFTALMKMFGIQRIRTTPFHPQSNGQIERWHRTLKAALMARGATARWTEELPTVLLGLRNATRQDSNLSPALMTYGSTLRIPSDFLAPPKPKIDDADFVRELTEAMTSLSPASNRKTATRPSFVFKDLSSCSHVFVRNDTVRSPLTPPYDGPFAVLERSGKHFKLQLPRRTAIISMDRLKPAYIYSEEEEHPTKRQALAKDSVLPTPEANKQPYVTRSGRITKQVRFA